MEILQAIFWKNDRDKKLNLSKKRDAQERAANRGVGPPLWMAARRCACSSAERNSVQSHSPLTPATASHLHRFPQSPPAGASDSLSDDSPKASISAVRRWDAPPSPAAVMVASTSVGLFLRPPYRTTTTTVFGLELLP
jgi:hypothetical protein